MFTKPISTIAVDHSAATPCTNPLVLWVLNEGWALTDPTVLVQRLGEAMLGLGFPLLRLRVSLRILHPQYIGTTYTWWRGQNDVEVYLPAHDVLETSAYLNSPYVAIFEGAGGMRRRLDYPGSIDEFPVLKELSDAGATDYVALPLLFSDGKINAITFAADRPGGFTVEELTIIYGALTVLGRLFEVHALRKTAETILSTYLGPQTGRRVLEGNIRRGSGDDLHAVIWFTDLRGSTALAEKMSRPQFLETLNDYFEAVAGAVLDHNGEVLRYIGDAALAIFPIGAPSSSRPETCLKHRTACTDALAAAEDAIERMAAINAKRQETGEWGLRFGIGLHLGEVLYGNIGVPKRLEFTVIGSAANIAARLEGMTKTLDRPLLVSSEFARVMPERLVSLGSHVLRGLRQPQELFTLKEHLIAPAL